MYAYAYNDPVNYTDPLGLVPQAWLGRNEGGASPPVITVTGTRIDRTGWITDTRDIADFIGDLADERKEAVRVDLGDRIRADNKFLAECSAISVDTSSFESRNELANELADVLGLDARAMHVAIESVFARSNGTGRIQRATVSRNRWFNTSKQRATGLGFSTSNSNESISPWQRSMGGMFAPAKVGFEGIALAHVFRATAALRRDDGSRASDAENVEDFFPSIMAWTDSANALNVHGIAFSPEGNHLVIQKAGGTNCRYGTPMAF